MSKGSTQRPLQVSKEDFNSSFDRIFNSASYENTCTFCKEEFLTKIKVSHGLICRTCDDNRSQRF